MSVKLPWLSLKFFVNADLWRREGVGTSDRYWLNSLREATFVNLRNPKPIKPAPSPGDTNSLDVIAEPSYNPIELAGIRLYNPASCLW